jgi:hypothetical protein
MAFTLNEKITTTLNWEEICLISVACGEYQRLYAEDADKDVLRTMKFLVDRMLANNVNSLLLLLSLLRVTKAIERWKRLGISGYKSNKLLLTFCKYTTFFW